jgi:hypothetical protein
MIVVETLYGQSASKSMDGIDTCVLVVSNPCLLPKMFLVTFLSFFKKTPL